jgi:hypothetical protein
VLTLILMVVILSVSAGGGDEKILAGIVIGPGDSGRRS